MGAGVQTVAEGWPIVRQVVERCSKVGLERSEAKFALIDSCQYKYTLQYGTALAWLTLPTAPQSGPQVWGNSS